MDIHGTGVDLIEIDRIRQIIERFGGKVLARVFSPREIAYAADKANPYPHLAARFAAKEAFIKALAPLPIAKVNLRDIELVAAEGMVKPEIVLYGPAAALFSSAELGNIMVSVSHSRTYAIATVTLLRR